MSQSVHDQTLDQTQTGSSIRIGDGLQRFPRGRVLLRRGSLDRLGWIALASVGVIMLLVGFGLSMRPEAQRSGGQEAVIRVYCASGIAKPMEQVIAIYNQRFGTQVELARTGGSGELAGQIQTEYETGLTGGADLYVTADPLLLERARAQGVVAERFALAEQKPVIALAADQESGITDLQSLLSDAGIKFGVASEKAAVGKMARAIAKREGLLTRLETQKTTDAENVMTLAQALVTGSLDAAIVWDTTVSQVNQLGASGDDGRPTLRIAGMVDEQDQFKSEISMGVASSTQQPTACLRFARFVTGTKESQQIFESFGFTFVPGDRWTERPEIHVYFGSMFTPVLEDTVREFAVREGISLYPRWEGCGKLVASMKSLDDPELFPDAFLACDVAFLDEVQDRFQPPIKPSKNQIVMAVRKSVATELDRPADLLATQFKVGLCDPEQSALGRLTREYFSVVEPEVPQARHGLYPSLRRRAAVVSDVGPTLISQLLAGGLDVAFVYRSNVVAVPQWQQKLRIIELESRPGSSATQPWAVAKNSDHPALVQRLFKWMLREEIQREFTRHGFERLQ